MDELDPDLVVPDPRKTIAQGCVKPFQTTFYSDCQDDLERFFRRAGLPDDVPWQRLPEKVKQLVWDGEPGGRQNWQRKWYGIRGFFEWLESRTYRMRCVEAWSMVIPWDGFPLSALLDKVEPLGSAKYVAFETVFRPTQMPGQSGLFQPLPWPYVEGLRLDEARNPLTILSVGVYVETLPNQNGAPIRLVVPWKYGFKSIKSIVRISVMEQQPRTSWNIAIPREYGFYANVNPEVDHPRWSQARERRIGKFFKQDTLMFNGYADQVAQLYSGMDLRRYY